MLNLLRRFSGAYRRYFIIGPLAKLVEATAKDPQDAARIIREAIPKQ